MNAASPTTTPDPESDNACINTLRFLSIDAVQEADSGHPGMPMGAASMAYVFVDPVPQSQSGQSRICKRAVALLP
jgi:transketolase